MNEKELSVALVLVVLCGEAAIASPFLTSIRISQPFSEVGILGPSGKIAGYPANVTAGENFTLDLFVANHEGRVMYYRVYEKVGNRSSTVSQSAPMSAPTVAYFDVVLKDNQSLLTPVTIDLEIPAANARLVFELWAYSADLGSFEYEGAWAQIWLNVTAAATQDTR